MFWGGEGGHGERCWGVGDDMVWGVLAPGPPPPPVRSGYIYIYIYTIARPGDDVTRPVRIHRRDFRGVGNSWCIGPLHPSPELVILLENAIYNPGFNVINTFEILVTLIPLISMSI